LNFDQVLVKYYSKQHFIALWAEFWQMLFVWQLSNRILNRKRWHNCQNVNYMDM